ncbi:MAG: SH3 domain-containing protein [Anaerolineales bacterium]
MRGYPLTALLLGLLAGCNFPGSEPVTPTLASAQVVETAQAIAQATLGAATPTPTQLPPTPSPAAATNTPLPAATLTPASPVVTANYNANIRRGPGENYEVLDFLLGGQQADVLGRYDNSPIGTWWYVRPIGGGITGWVWSGALVFSGSDFGIPALTPAPTSTSTPAPTSAPTNTPTPTPTATP